jgi:hypothetical protein
MSDDQGGFSLIKGSNLDFIYFIVSHTALARPLRIFFPDAWYHVMNRSAGYRAIFRDSSHYEKHMGSGLVS